MEWIPNLHPPITAFPFAFCVLLLCIEGLLLRQRTEQLLFSRDLVLVAFGVGVLLAFLSGYHGSEFADLSRIDIADAVSVHHTWGKVLLWLALPQVCSGLLSRRARTAQRSWLSVYFILLCVSAALTVYVGWLGGELVFSLGAGVAARVP